MEKDYCSVLVQTLRVCLHSRLRGFILKDTLKMFKLQWMLLVWCPYDLQQVISPSILAENRVLSWSVASLLTRIQRPSPACFVAALICFNGCRQNKQTCCQRRRGEDAGCVSRAKASVPSLACTDILNMPRLNFPRRYFWGNSNMKTLYSTNYI